MPEPIDEQTMSWLREQYRDPRAAYTAAEWAKLAGMDRQRIVRWFEKKKLIIRARKGDRRTQHEITRDDLEMRWPGFWPSIQRRLAGLFQARRTA